MGGGLSFEEEGSIEQAYREQFWRAAHLRVSEQRMKSHGFQVIHQRVSI